MTNINTSIDIPFDSVLYADYEFYYILTSQGHFEPRLNHLTTRLDAVKSDDQHKDVDKHTIWLRLYADYEFQYSLISKGHF